MEDYPLSAEDIEIIVEALQLLLDYKNHGITKNDFISDLLFDLDPNNG